MTIEKTSGHKDVDQTREQFSDMLRSLGCSAPPSPAYAVVAVISTQKLEQFNDMFRSLCYEPFSDVAIIVGNSLTICSDRLGWRVTI